MSFSFVRRSIRKPPVAVLRPHDATGTLSTADSAHMRHVDVPAVVITMPHSHYAEKARWALDRLFISYREERTSPLLHRLATTR